MCRPDTADSKPAVDASLARMERILPVGFQEEFPSKRRAVLRVRPPRLPTISRLSTWLISWPTITARALFEYFFGAEGERKAFWVLAAAGVDIRQGQAKDAQLLALNAQLMIDKYEDKEKFAKAWRELKETGAPGDEARRRRERASRGEVVIVVSRVRSS